MLQKQSNHASKEKKLEGSAQNKFTKPISCDNCGRV